MLPHQNVYFANNKNLKAAGVSVEFTREQTLEYARCQRDPIYFIENYVKVLSLDKGIVQMKLFPYQKRMIEAIHNNRNTIAKLFRQAGKSAIAAAYFCWYCNFNENKLVAILANKLAISREIFSRVQFMFEELPWWLKQGVIEWNKTSFQLENKTRCFCAASSPSAIRGLSCNIVFLDEFAFLSPTLAEEFVASVFPTLSSSESSKLIIVSTPKGMNHFYRLWNEAEQGLNGFVPVTGHWTEHPLRNQAWADDMLAKLGPVKYAQEITCVFQGSSYTLIAGEKIAALPMKQPTVLLPTLYQYYQPIEGHSYVITVDVSRGAGLDYSTFTVIDIATSPYRVSCVFRDNTINTLVYPEFLMNVAIKYNNAFVLIETNDLGEEVANILYYELEYENVYMSSRDDIKEGGGKKYSPGCRTTKRTKAIGCDRLKTLIENDQLEINDANIIDEMSTFVRVGGTYKAEENKHDDLMMCLVIFGYLTSTPAFADLFDFSLRKKLIESQLREVEDQMLPIGFVTRGDETEVQSFVEPKTNTRWFGNDDLGSFQSAFG